MEEGKGNRSERKRGLLGKVILGETLPVMKGESSLRCGQDGAVEVQGEGRVEAAGEETQGTQFHHQGGPWLTISIPEALDMKELSMILPIPRGSLPSCPSQLIHDCLYGYIWPG